MCIFLILARRRLYGEIGMGMGMGMSFAGNGLCAGRRESERQNREWWQNTEWAEQGMTDYYCSLNK
jgi:hypothetical protein